MSEVELEKIAKALVASPKGILAADWSTGSAEKHFAKHGIPCTEETRRIYRQMLFTTPGIEEFISGVILYDETIRQKGDDGKPFPQLLAEKGIIPGIKVDKGAVDMPNFPGEEITEGLDGLRDRLAEYHGMGAKFAKWRAVIAIGEGTPTKTALEANAHDLARYAAFCQEGDIVPIVEPEVLLDGDHTLHRCLEVTEAMLKITFDLLTEHRVYLEAVVLKPNIVQPGKVSTTKASPEEIAASTVGVMKEVVPAKVPGIAFLSGGMTPTESTIHLNAINSMGKEPWELTFSYARALQQPVLEVWKGKDENKDAAQKAFLKRVRLNSLARQGKYSPDMEKE